MDPERWIERVRLAAVPFAFLEVAIERGNYPPGDERWAWAITGVFAAGAVVLAAAAGDVGVHLHHLAGLVFDAAVVSGYVVLYAFEPGTPVRLLLVLVVLEGALRYRIAGGVGAALAAVPALALFEWRAPLPEFDPGHVVGPFGILTLVGVAAGALAERARAWSG